MYRQVLDEVMNNASHNVRKGVHSLKNWCMVNRLRRVDRNSRLNRFSFDLSTELTHMHDRPAYELQITQLVIVHINKVISRIVVKPINLLWQ
jgi:hypothetical protein